MRPRRDPDREELTLTENAFQARVIVAARMNGWRLDLADVHPKAQPPSPLHPFLNRWLGKIPLKKLWDFLMEKTHNLFTLAYHTHDSRYSQGGYPDLTLVHPRRRLVAFAELKKCGGYPSLEQRIWLASLDCALEHTPNVSVHLWDPDDWPEIIAFLGGEDPGLFNGRGRRRTPPRRTMSRKYKT